MNAKQSNVLKIVLAIVLGIGFILALGNSVRTIAGASPARPAPPPPPRRPPAAVSTQPAATAPTVVVTAAAVVPQEPAKAEPSKRAWPVFELAEIIDYDPFAIGKPGDAVAASKLAGAAAASGKEAGQGGADDSKSTAAEPESGFKGRIHAIYQRGGQTTALVGSKTVRAGDQLEGAGRVVEVDQGGVMLEVNK